MRIDMLHAVAGGAGALVAVAEFHFRVGAFRDAANNTAMKRFSGDLGGFLGHFTVAIAYAIDNIGSEE